MMQGSILIVDDDDLSLSILKNGLKLFNPDYVIVTALDGLTALDYIREQSFDLVVTDYWMSGMNGLELVEAIHAIRPELNVVMTTAYAPQGLEVEACRVNVFRFIIKPLDIRILWQVAQETSERLTAQQEVQNEDSSQCRGKIIPYHAVQPV